jgi:hypothetical protein
MSTKKQTIQEKREHLKNLSNKAQAIREQLLHDCKNDAEIQAVNALKVNDIIIEYLHKNPKHKEFKSFKGWMKEGKCVKKGEKAFLVWGKPTEKKEDGTTEPIAEDENGNMFYPVSFVFSNAQVRELSDASS